ncbi:MAG TPA: cytochrome c oxidase subunit II [Stellaceae bacterium]|nr:cytochrome c oxidase subunit II [Stellaceae bacterium]
MVRLTSWIRESAAARACALLALAFVAMAALVADAGAAQPRNWEIGFQPSATPVHDRITAFHDELLVIITLITVFVLGLLVFVMVRFHHSRNPVPTRTSHNTLVEILWTVVPILILVFIAIPSFKLMYYMDRVPKAAMTIKVTGNQWFWHYEYPDQKIAFDSNLVADKDLKPGQLHLLSVDNPLVVPAGATVRVQVTGVPDGVIHSWFMPSFGVQEYAVPGRLNESWFEVEKPGTYYGECNQICGVNHSKMPIEVKAVTQPEFDQWLAAAKKKFAAATPANDAASDPTRVAVATVAGMPGGAGAKPAESSPAGY